MLDLCLFPENDFRIKLGFKRMVNCEDTHSIVLHLTPDESIEEFFNL